MVVSYVGRSLGVKKTCSQHAHETWEILLNLGGYGHMLIGDKSYPFEPGTIICLPPGTPHGKVSDEGFLDIYLETPNFFLSKIADENNVITLKDDQAKNFESLMKIAHHVYLEKKDNYQSVIDALHDAMNQMIFSWREHRFREPDVARIKRKLMQSFPNPEFTISELRYDTSYSSDHLRRLFKKSTGMTPVEYLTSLRLNHAKKLMEENQLLYTVAEIGTMSGYYDSRYFSRVFKKNIGMTPQEYINLNKNVTPPTSLNPASLS